MLCALLVCLNGCSGCNGANEAVPENTPLPLEGNLKAKERVLEKAKVADSSIGSDAAQALTVGRTNPFLTIDEAREFGKSGREILNGVTLSALFYSEKNSYAIIDGFILRVGDMFGDKEVIKIEKKAVILRDKATEYMVLLKDE